MKTILIIHTGEIDSSETVTFLDQSVVIQRVACRGEVQAARQLIQAYDGQVDAIGLEGLPMQLQLGACYRPHSLGSTLALAAKHTPVVDGSGVRGSLERRGVTLADRAQPGIFAEKRILMTPGLNHAGLAQSLTRHGSAIRYADPEIYFALPAVPGVGYRQTLVGAAPATLDQLKDYPFRRLQPREGQPHTQRAAAPFAWADILAGDVGAIRRYAPRQLRHKTILMECACEADLDDLQQRGASIAITLMPALDGKGQLGRWSAAVIESLLVALRTGPELPLTESTYLDLMADLDWSPAIRFLQAAETGVNRFAFVIHPLNVEFIHQHRWFHWTRHLPDTLVEAVSAYIPPLYLSHITGAQSPLTGQKVEGYLLALGATPRAMMKHDERFTYLRLNQAARLAERLGARIMGLGAFTSVIGDAGITVAHEADIAITSGNSLTVAATLESAKQAVIKMGAIDLTKGKAMVVGATGSIGSVCARLLAQAIHAVVLVSIEPEKLIDLKRRILVETPGAQVTIATRPDESLGECDLIVTATSAFGQRVLDVTKCKPGAVICDVARPCDINEAEAALRPDVLVIESGEVLIPGDVSFGYDIGLPPKTSYACLAETCLLAMEGRFEDYTLGRNIEMERVKEIYKLFRKHGFKLAGLRSFGCYMTDADLDQKRLLAQELCNDSDRFEQLKKTAGMKLAQIPVMAKGVGAAKAERQKWAWLGLVTLAGLLGLWWLRPGRPYAKKGRRYLARRLKEDA